MAGTVIDALQLSVTLPSKMGPFPSSAESLVHAVTTLEQHPTKRVTTRHRMLRQSVAQSVNDCAA